MEVLTFILSSHEENFDMLNRADDKNKAVIIANPRTSEFEVNFSRFYRHPPQCWVHPSVSSPMCSQLTIAQRIV
jgi:hypothetical protein